jgi:hypothetical protein
MKTAHYGSFDALTHKKSKGCQKQKATNFAVQDSIKSKLA